MMNIILLMIEKEIKFCIFDKLKKHKFMKREKIEKQVINFPICFNDRNDMVLEFYVCETNTTEPYKPIKELGITIYDKNEEKRNSDDYVQGDNMYELGVDEIENLIKYLQKVKRHIKNFNEKSKPL